MATVETLQAIQGTSIEKRSGTTSYPADSYRFDLTIAVLCAILIGGLFLDGWAHNHGKVDDTFFTPWHAVLYSAYGVVGLAFVTTQARNMLKGYHWLRALPKGYFLGLIGVFMFGLAGAFDFVWHSLFGFEASTEALLSPAHLTLATGAMLFILAPLRATWQRRTSYAANSWRELLPAILSLTTFMAVLLFFTQFSHFLTAPRNLLESTPLRSDRDLLDITGIWSFLTPAGLMIGLVLLALRRWKLPLGAVTFMFTVTTLLMLWVRFRYIVDINRGQYNYLPLLLAPMLAGLLADVLIWRWQVSIERERVFRIFAFIVPMVMTLAWWVIGLLLYTTWWRIHMWLGVSFLSGVMGLFLSYIALPPAIPQPLPEVQD